MTLWRVALTLSPLVLKPEEMRLSFVYIDVRSFCECCSRQWHQSYVTWFDQPMVTDTGDIVYSTTSKLRYRPYYARSIVSIMPGRTWRDTGHKGLMPGVSWLVGLG